MGKKPQGPYAGKSLVFSTRITPDLRAKLGDAAAEKGYSLSQEIEERLRQSFTLEEKNSEIFGSEQNYLLMRTVALAMQWAQASPNYTSRDLVTDWTTDPGKFDVVVRTVVNVLEAIRPLGPSPTEPDLRQAAIDEFSTKQISAMLWKSIQEADVAAPIDKGTRHDQLMSLLKRKLGDVADRARPQILTADDLREIINKQAKLSPQKPRRSTKRTGPKPKRTP